MAAATIWPHDGAQGRAAAGSRFRAGLRLSAATPSASRPALTPSTAAGLLASKAKARAAERYGRDAEYLANVVMRLPAWYAALDEVRAHLAQARGEERRRNSKFLDGCLRRHQRTR